MFGLVFIMSVIYTYSLSSDFPSGLQIHDLQSDVDSNVTITTTLLHIEVYEDDVKLNFANALTAGEQTELDNVVSNYVFVATAERPDIFIDNATGLLTSQSSTERVSFIGVQSTQVIISKDSQGDYTSIGAALSSNNSPNTIFNVYPGTYVESNPLEVPANCVLQCNGIPGNTTIVAANPSNDLVVMNGYSKIMGFILHGASGVGSRGIYYEGTNGGGAYMTIENMIVRNCDIGIEINGGPDSVICFKSTIYPWGSGTSRGIYVHNGGQFVGSNVRATGVVALNWRIAVGIECKDPTSKITFGTGSSNECDIGLLLDNSGEMELALFPVRQCNTGIKFGETGSSRIRTTAVHVMDSVNYDLDVQASEADIHLSASELDHEKINNPNGVKLNAEFVAKKNYKNFRTEIGDIRFGTIQDPTSVAFGEGKYTTDTYYIMTNYDLDQGNWNDISASARSSDNSIFDIFANTNPDNCLYIGSTTVIHGLKLNITSSVVNLSREDIIWEYWDGISWTNLNRMCTQNDAPYYNIYNGIFSFQGKSHIRFGSKATDNWPELTLNSITRKWLRCRVINTLSSIPSAEYIKVHASHSIIRSDGFIEYYGNARKTYSLILHYTGMFNGESLATQPLYLSNDFYIPKLYNVLNVGSKACLNMFIPQNIDTTFPIKLKIAYVLDDSSSGNINLRLRYAKTNSECDIYFDNTNNATPDITTINKSITIDNNSNNKEFRTDILIDISDLNPVPTINNNEHMMWFVLDRISDTYSGQFIISQVSSVCIIWSAGGHLEHY